MAASFFKIALSPALHRCFQPRKFAVGHGHVLTADRRASHSQASTSAGDSTPAFGSCSRGRARHLLHASASTQQPGPSAKIGGRLVLLDAFALLFRAHFGLKNVRLATTSGEDTSILFAFLRSLLDLLQLEPPPTHFAVVFDAAGKTFSDEVEIAPEIREPDQFIDDSTYVPRAQPARPARIESVSFRHEMYPGYKGQRPPTPEPITEAVKQLRDLIRVMGIPEIIVPGIEADDVIGTVAVRALKEGLQVVIASPDKDFFQLLQPGLQLLRPPKKDYQGPLLGSMVPYNAQAFQDEWNLQPSQWADVLALSGDAADNVPGVKGVGIKTAPVLVRTHGNIEGVLAAAQDERKKGLRDKLTASEAAPAARLSKKLVTIHTDIALPPVRFPMDHLALHPPTDLTRAAVKAAFASLEFAQHEKRLEVIWDNMSRSQAELSGEAWSEGWHSAVKPASEFVPG